MGRPLEVRLEVTRTEAVPDEEIGFQVEATGRALIRILIDYDDGSADTLAAQGATGAGLNTEHAFGDPGTFRVRAGALDSDGQEVWDEVQILVTAPSPLPLPCRTDSW
jgi:hypothetical protein